MLDKIHDIIKSDFANPIHNHFLLAVSGGQDSMVMASCFQKLNLQFEVLHCHFGLRPEAYKETKLVLKWCAHNKIKALVAYFPTFLLERQGQSLQEQCRNLRYAWFNEMKSRRDAEAIVTAHHAADQRETFFINLIRGAGVFGLTGIKSSTDSVYRPMLTLTQEEISNYARDHNVPFLDDASNFSDDYLRNNIRINLLPKFEQLDRNALKGFESSLGNLREASQFIQEQINLYSAKYVSKLEDGLNINSIESWPSFVLKTFLAKLGFSRDVILQLFEDPSKPGRFFETKKLHLLTVPDGFYIVRQKHDKINLEIAQPGTYPLDETRVVEVHKSEIPRKTKSFDSSSEIVIDAERLEFPLNFRQWQAGDRMTPLGMSGHSKKIQDILTDAKVNKLDKKSVLVAEDASGDIFWLVGLRISETVRIKEESTVILKVSLKSRTT